VVVALALLHRNSYRCSGKGGLAVFLFRETRRHE